MWTPNFGHRKLVTHVDNGEPHFLTFSCYGRLPLLSKDRTRLWFVEALEEARQSHKFHLWAWVIMPEHIHLLIWPPPAFMDADPAGNQGKTAGILADIKRPVGRKAIRYLSEKAPKFLERLTVRNRGRTYRRFWQAGTGYDESISEVGALHEVIEYIHLNPVRRGLVARPEDWEWSSARDWLGMAMKAKCLVDRTLPTALDIPWKRRGIVNR